jgi:ketosteroid isomerase-like protein
MKITVCFVIILVILLHLNLFPQQKDSAVARFDAERAVLLATDSLFSKLSAEKGTGTAFLAYMAENASLFPAGENITSGRENIKKHFEKDPPNTLLTWTPLKAEVSASTDLGYTYGLYQFKFNDDNGHPVYRQGKYVTIWKKQSDGSWKFILDIGNANPLPTHD